MRTRRSQPISAVVQLLFKSGGRIYNYPNVTANKNIKLRVALNQLSKAWSVQCCVYGTMHYKNPKSRAYIVPVNLYHQHHIMNNCLANIYHQHNYDEQLTSLHISSTLCDEQFPSKKISSTLYDEQLTSQHISLLSTPYYEQLPSQHISSTPYHEQLPSQHILSTLL